MSGFSVLVAMVVAVGIVGIVVPLLPGALLVLAAIVVWGMVEGGTAAWLVVAAATALLLAAQLLKYLIPGRSLRDAGLPASSLAVGAVLGVVGFFVLPVVGLVVGFVAGVYAAELRRLRNHTSATSATVSAVTAVGLSMAIETAGALLAAAVWLVGAVRLT